MDVIENVVQREVLHFLLKSKAMDFTENGVQRKVIHFPLKSKAIVYRLYRKRRAKKRSSFSTQK